MEEALESLVVLCFAATVGTASGIAAGCKMHLRRVKENQKYLDGQVDVTVRYQWADRLWLRLFLLAAGVAIVILGWQFLFCDSLGLLMLTLVISYWVTRARRAYNNLAVFD